MCKINCSSGCIECAPEEHSFEEVLNQLAAAQAREAKLREALEHAIDVMRERQLESPFCKKALAIPAYDLRKGAMLMMRAADALERLAPLDPEIEVVLGEH